MMRWVAGGGTATTAGTRARTRAPPRQTLCDQGSREVRAGSLLRPGPAGPLRRALHHLLASPVGLPWRSCPGCCCWCFDCAWVTAHVTDSGSISCPGFCCCFDYEWVTAHVTDSCSIVNCRTLRKVTVQAGRGLPQQHTRTHPHPPAPKFCIPPGHTLAVRSLCNSFLWVQDDGPTV